MTIDRSERTGLIFCIIIAVAFFRTPLMNVCQFAGYFISAFDKLEIVYYVFYAVLLLIGVFVLIAKKINWRRSLFLSLCLVVFVFLACFRGSVFKFAEEDLPTLCLFMFIPLLCTQIKFSQNLFLKVMNYGIAIHFFFGCVASILFIMTGQLYGADGMLATYAVAVPTAYYLYGFFTFSRNNFLFLVLALIGTAFSLYTGSRGGWLILIFSFLFGLKLNKSALKGIIIIVLLIIIMALFSDKIVGLFVDTRLAELLQDGGMGDTDNRVEMAWKPVIDGFSQSPFLGWGSFGDRIFTGGSWAHNLFLEILCDYGIVIGGLFCLWFIWKSIIVIVRRDVLLTVWFIMSVPQLLLSSSIMRSTYFWIYLGFLLAYNGTRVRKGVKSIT